jgi:ribonucleoside-diphosphate reductase beta chain
MHVKKRNNTYESFDTSKIEHAIHKGMIAVAHGTKKDAKALARLIEAKLERKASHDPEYVWTVEDIQDLVEEELMSSDFHDVAKAYILYRAQRTAERRRNIFKKRIHLKPYEYPELLQYVDAIRHSYWIHTEFNFAGDVQHFSVAINDVERSAIKNTMLAIAQIEVAVKTFWGDIYKRFPKAEIGSVGATFAESEVRHQDAYSHLLEILGLNEDFEQIKNVPAIIDRVSYLNKSLKNSRSEDNKEYAQTLLLFSLFIEHVSLFSQFLIMMSFNKHKNLFKGISNVVEATSKEEQIHGLFGIDIINIIKEENPDWFDDDYHESIQESCQEAYDAECGILEWIFEKGELDFLSIKTIQEFIKHRFNNSLRSIGIDPIFQIDEAEVAKTEWFDDEIIATKHGDFFDKRSVNYNKKSKSVTAHDLF